MAPSVRSSANLATLAVSLLLLASGFVSAVPDSSLCPFELGYGPSFNADGTVLFCTKGTETFQVDDAGILARSLRGMGTSLQAILSGLIDGNLAVLGRFIEADANLILPDGTSHPASDPALVAFVTDTFVFPPGVDRTAIFQFSNYQFLDNTDPRFASVHLTAFTSKYTVDTDSFWHFNLVNGTRVWQIHQTTNLKLSPPK